MIARRTATLGALVVAAVMSNVVMLNFCYDVPVKLLSSTFLLMAVFLAGPELGRLFRAVVLHRSVEASVPAGPRFARRWQRAGAALLALAFVGYQTYRFVDMGLERYAKGDGAPAPPFYGNWEVEDFVVNGHAPAVRWQRLSLRKGGWATVRDSSGGRRALHLDVDRAHGTMTFGLPDRIEPSTLAFAELDDAQLELTGQLGDDYVTLRLRRSDDSRQLLVTRGFHWINEYPLNR